VENQQLRLMKQIRGLFEFGRQLSKSLCIQGSEEYIVIEQGFHLLQNEGSITRDNLEAYKVLYNMNKSAITNKILITYIEEVIEIGLAYVELRGPLYYKSCERCSCDTPHAQGECLICRHRDLDVDFI